MTGNKSCRAHLGGHQGYQPGNQSQHHKDAQHPLPHHSKGMDYILIHILFLLVPLLQDRIISEILQYHATGHHRGDLSGHVSGYRMHQQVVLGVSLLPHLLNDP